MFAATYHRKIKYLGNVYQIMIMIMIMIYLSFVTQVTYPTFS